MAAELAYFQGACGRLAELVGYLDGLQPFITEQREQLQEVGWRTPRARA